MVPAPVSPREPIKVPHTLSLSKKINDFLSLPTIDVAKHLCNTQFVYFQNITWKDLIDQKSRYANIFY